MSTATDGLRTPPMLFKELNSVTPFFWDACCNKDNCLVNEQVKLADDLGWEEYDYLKTDFIDDLEFYSGKSIFINPPYSDVAPFIKKAWEDAKHFRVVMLLKADMSTNWFNSLLKESWHKPMHHNQEENSLKASYAYLLELMQIRLDSDECIDPAEIGILHLRKRIKFYGTESMMHNDALSNPNSVLAGFHSPRYNCEHDDFDYTMGNFETKHFKRVEDGIQCKSSGTFPSMLVVLDRRGE